jgi:plasmid stabilization system protein ParE
MAKVRLSGPVRDYLRNEARYLRQRSHPAAEAFLSRLMEARKNLGRFPQMGFEKDGLPIRGTRCLVVDDYILDYEIHGEDVFVTAIRPGQKPEIISDVSDDFDYES